MSDGITTLIEPAKLNEARVAIESGRQAMAEPVPGAVRDAIEQRTPIKVGSYSVRACEDGDIELLSLLEHPMNQLRLETAAIGAVEPEDRKKAFEAIWTRWVESHSYRGPMAWQICFILTHPGEDVDAIFDEGGLVAIRDAAKKEFRRLGPRQLMELTPVCINQYLRSWNTMLSHEPMADDDSGELVKKNSLTPTRSATG